MQRECRLQLRYNRKRNCVFVFIIMVVMCWFSYTVLITLVTSVRSNAFDRNFHLDDSMLEHNSRHHNRNLQNSDTSNDDTNARVLYHVPTTLTRNLETKLGISQNYLVEGTPDDKLGRLDNLDSVYMVDDEEHKGIPKAIIKNNSRGNKSRNLPQVIIIGVKKAGTRALLEYLRMHPKIKAPGPEPHFFDKNYKKGLDWYRNLMPEVHKDQITMEKTPSYFVTKGIPEKIQKMSKNTKLIIVFRDPVTRAISDYTQLLSRNPKVKSFEEMVFVDNKTKIIDTSWTIVKIGVYAQHLAKWLHHFPIRQIHFVGGENLIENPALELKRLQEFLELEQVITGDYFTFNKTKGFPCYRKGIEASIKWHCLNSEKGRQHPVIDPSVIQRLRDFYRPFNIKLFNMIGQSFKWS